MASFYKFLKKKILTPQEHLEIILDREYSVSEVLIILLKKVWRNIYNFIQRLFSKPSHNFSIANGWSPDGLKGLVKLNLKFSIKFYKKKKLIFNKMFLLYLAIFQLKNF